MGVWMFSRVWVTLVSLNGDYHRLWSLLTLQWNRKIVAIDCLVVVSLVYLSCLCILFFPWNAFQSICHFNDSLMLFFFIPGVKLDELYTAWYWVALIFFAAGMWRVLPEQMDSYSPTSALPRRKQKAINLLQFFHVFYNLGELFKLHLGFNSSSSDQDLLPMRRINFLLDELSMLC